MKKENLLLRICLSPFVFLWGCFMVLAGCLFPVPMIAVISLISLFTMPFVWLLNKTGATLEVMDPLITVSRFNSVNHFLGVTIFIWGAFAVAGEYIRTGHVFTGESETTLA